MYLLVPSAPVCQALQVQWAGGCAMLVALLVPQAAAPAGAGAAPPGHAHPAAQGRAPHTVR
jgi:hypothetical protein